MLKISFIRIGKSNQPSFRIKIKDSRKSKGKFIEDLGYYSSITKKFFINREKISYWIKNGAQVSKTVIKILNKENK